jgi:hypothetical protein
MIGGNAIKLLSKFQIHLLEQYDNVYIDFENLCDMLTLITKLRRK